MNGQSSSHPHARWQRFLDGYQRVLRVPVVGLAIVAGVGLAVMMSVTCADVVLRIFRISLTGAYDLVKLSGAITIACALPYTTAVKGHVAIEYFFHKLSRRGRIGVDAVIRILVLGLFAVLGWQSVRYGVDLRANNEVSQTLQIPVFWVPWVIAVACGLVVLVTVYHLLRPGQPMIPP